MKLTFDTQISKASFPDAGEAFSDRFVSNYSTMVSQLSQVLNGGVALADNLFGTVISLTLSHGVPMLIPSPLTKQSTPLGVWPINCDTQPIPNVSMTTIATVNGVSTTASKGYLFVTALYPQLGTVLTDWVSYTPTGTWTTNTTYAGKWRRVGDTAEVVARVNTSGPPNAVNLTSVTIPSGLTIDTAKLTNSIAIKGILGAGFATIAVTRFVAICLYQDTTSISANFHSVSGSTISTAGFSATSPGPFGAGDFIEVIFRVPIVGWSSAPSVTAKVTLFFGAA